MTAEIETLIPSLPLKLTKEAARDVIADHQPNLDDDTFDAGWLAFENMRHRVAMPDRRRGAPCSRIEGSATLVPDPLPARGVE